MSLTPRLFRVRAIGLLLAPMLALASGPADAAPNIAGTSFDTCGNWVDKLRDFGKFKIRNYNDYIPLNFQAPTPYDVPRVRIEFGDGSGTGVDALCAAGTSCFRMQFYFTDEMGVWWEVSASGAPVSFPSGGLVPFTEEAIGSYNQKGNNVKMSLDPAPAQEGLRRMLSNTGQLAIFGERNLIVAIGGPLVVDPDGPTPCQINSSGTLGRCTPVPTLRKTQIKARLNGNGTLKFKIKSKFRYDIDTDVVDDVFDAGGRMNFKGKGGDCPLPAPPPS